MPATIWVMVRQRLAALDERVWRYMSGADRGGNRVPAQPSTWASPWACLTAVFGLVIFVLQFAAWYRIGVVGFLGHAKASFSPLLSGGWWLLPAVVAALPPAYWLLCVAMVSLGRVRFGFVDRARMFAMTLGVLVALVVELVKPPSAGDPGFRVSLLWTGWVSLILCVGALAMTVFGPRTWIPDSE